jgi:hypothetical protein
MAKKIRYQQLTQTQPQGPVHCACVIHGSGYSWDYVERLHSMLSRNLSMGIILHVYTEAERDVPDHMIKHSLRDLGVSGPKKSWWYKLQLFNNKHHQGPLLYFDLDVVITDNIDWIVRQPLEYLWAPRDFKHLWQPYHAGINSSVMWWDTNKFAHVWHQFQEQDFNLLRRRYHGDQDFLSDVVDQTQRRFMDERLIRSWKWECLDGGWDFERRCYKTPDTGTDLKSAGILVFHGNPKPHECNDLVINQHWK